MRRFPAANRPESKCVSAVCLPYVHSKCAIGRCRSQDSPPSLIRVRNHPQLCHPERSLPIRLRISQAESRDLLSPPLRRSRHRHPSKDGSTLRSAPSSGVPSATPCLRLPVPHGFSRSHLTRNPLHPKVHPTYATFPPDLASLR
jgi:hypothetical protein